MTKDNSKLTESIKAEILSVTRNELSKRDKTLLFASVAGSHIWGLSRPDSDFDVRGIYQDDTLSCLDIYDHKDTVEFTIGDIDGQFYEIRKFLRMLCKHNGNMVTLLLSPINLYSTLYVPWTDLANKFLTQKLKHYYKGYALSQRKRALSQRGGKALLYTYREIFAGLYLMHYGKMEFNFNVLWDAAQQNNWYNVGLLFNYFPDYKKEVSEEQWNRFYIEWDGLVEILEEVTEKSLLPEDYDGWEECSSYLKQLRIRRIK